MYTLAEPEDTDPCILNHVGRPMYTKVAMPEPSSDQGTNDRCIDTRGTDNRTTDDRSRDAEPWTTEV